MCTNFVQRQQYNFIYSLEAYNDLLRSDEISEQRRNLIKDFLLPYEISLLKYTLNGEYFNNPFPVDLHHNHKHIAPSLKRLKENQFDIALGYPKWFLFAFPDVALWARYGEGAELVLRRFKNLSEKDAIEGNQIKAFLLHEIIQLYQRNINKPLECKKY